MFQVAKTDLRLLLWSRNTQLGFQESQIQLMRLKMYPCFNITKKIICPLNAIQIIV